MEVIKAYARRSLFWILFSTGILCLVMNSVFHFAMSVLSEKILVLFVAQSNAKIPRLSQFVQQFSGSLDMIELYFVPVTTGCLFLLGFLLWLILHVSFVRLMEQSYLISPQGKKKEEKTVQKPSDNKERKEKNNRLFLHLMSALQREGRLLDFFSEDLDEYDDDQIGGAVRSIHENCKKAMSKYLTTRAVVDEDEGDEITVQPGFDPNAVKLTGNVTGDPPFRGVVRHRGWKAARIDLPALSGSRDPDIIAPAEVEIL